MITEVKKESVFRLFALQLGEFTDIPLATLLVVFVRYVMQNYRVLQKHLISFCSLITWDVYRVDIINLAVNVSGKEKILAL